MAPGPIAEVKYLSIARDFEAQLRSGALRVGDRLPSVRQLGRERRVSQATAVSCYLWLERQGYVRARPKSGFYVSRLPATSELPVTATRPRRPVRVPALDFEAGDDAPRHLLDLGPAVVAPSMLPLRRVNRSLRTALAAFDDAPLREGDPLGHMRLRRQLARLLFRQGTEVRPEEIVVTSGTTESLALAVRAVTTPGDVVAIETPGCFEMLHGLRTLGLRALEVPHRPGGGVDLDALETAVTKYQARVLMLNATCHNPTGDCAPDHVKAALAAFAARHDIAIIEADTFGDLLFSGQRPRTIGSFDDEGRVMQTGSLAHFVAPGLHVGWLHTGRYFDTVDALKRTSNPGRAPVIELAMAEFLESGSFDRHLRKLRPELWRNVTTIRQDVLRLFPAGTRVSDPAGGLVLWIQLPPAIDGDRVRRDALAKGIHILSGSAFSPNRLYKSCIRLALGHPLEVLRPAVKTLAGIIAHATTH